jgi:hypothetical protein
VKFGCVEDKAPINKCRIGLVGTFLSLVRAPCQLKPPSRDSGGIAQQNDIAADFAARHCRAQARWV